MLDKGAFKEGIKRLLRVFPNWNVKCDDPETMKTWYEFFEKMSNDEFYDMVLTYIKKEKFHPTIAGLIAHKPSRRVGVPPSKSILGERDDW